MSGFKNIELNELELAWNFVANDEFKTLYESKDLRYVDLTDLQRDRLIIEFLKTLDSELQVAGEHREQVWENGWGENLKEFKASKNFETLTPKYFSKIPEIRWKQKWITPANQTMEYELFDLLLTCIFEKYLSHSADIYEFGCGTGHNLLKIRSVNRVANITGLDWARSSQALIEQISLQIEDQRIHGVHFDYFRPNEEFSLAANSRVLTVASLEQTGKNFVKFVDYLISNKPQLVIHIEPIGEVLDENNLLDNLSLRYFRKRNYLEGLVSHIEGLASQGKAEIIDLHRTHVGSFFIEGYTVLVWRPL